MKTIAVIGGHTEIVALLVRLINQYDATEALAFYNAEELLEASFDLVLLSSGVSEADEAIIRAHVNQPIIQNYGGGSGLLRAELLPFLS